MRRLLFIFWIATTLFAQAPAQKPQADALGRSTPRGTFLGFFRDANQELYQQAVLYLEVPGSGEAETLARELKAVLDLELDVTVSQLPNTALGNLRRGFPSDRQYLGTVRTGTLSLDIVMSRVHMPDGSFVWLFSRETLAGIPRIYVAVESGNLIESFPSFFRKTRFFGLPLWRLIAIILALAISLALTFFLTRALLPFLRRLLARITGEQNDRRLHLVHFPIAFLVLAIAIRVLAAFAVSLMARNVWIGISRLIFVVGVCWLLLLVSDVTSSLTSKRLFTRQAGDKVAFVLLLSRLFKILVVLLAGILLLHFSGVDVTAMLAGLGIGGIALALAAQKTLENFFGGVSILSRDILRVGDFCKIGDQIGTVSDVGFGSIRVRTLDRTVLSMPNAVVSQTNIENYSMRDRIWLHHIFGIRYDTPRTVLEEVLLKINELLHTDSHVERESGRIRLIKFGPSSFDVEVFAYILTVDYNRFLVIQEELMLKMLAAIEESGAHLAIPAGTTYLISPSPSAGTS
jgi:MscS family membrane protein